MNIEIGSFTIPNDGTACIRYDEDGNEMFTSQLFRGIQLKKQYKKPCWFWGLQGLDWKTNKDIAFKIGSSVSQGNHQIECSLDFPDDDIKRRCKRIDVSYIIYEEELVMYNDDVEFTQAGTLKVDFGSVFKDVPKVFVSIQSLHASQMTYLDIQIVDVKKKFCKIKADFDDEFIQSVKVGVFAYDNQYEPTVVTSQLNEIMIANDEEHEKDRKKAEEHMKNEKEKILQVQSGVFTTTKTTPQSIPLENYETFPSGISFITGFKGINKQTLPMKTVMTPMSFDTFEIQVNTHGNFTTISHSYFISSYILETQLNDNDDIFVTIQLSGSQTMNQINANQQEEIKCTESTDESECCSICHQHKINTVLQCGHALYCHCCATSSPIYLCPICHKHSSKFHYFNEMIDFSN